MRVRVCMRVCVCVCEMGRVVAGARGPPPLPHGKNSELAGGGTEGFLEELVRANQRTHMTGLKPMRKREEN